jgi:beta-phosphoglucomutase
MGNPMPINAVVFDLEGTIIDVEALHRTAHLEAAATIGLRLTREQATEAVPHFVGGPDEEVARELAALASQPRKATQLLQHKTRRFEELLQTEENIVSRHGFRSFLDWIKGQTVKLGIATVSKRDLVFYLLERAGLLDEFKRDWIVVREDVVAPKPAPDVYLETARRMGIEARAQLVIEDSPGGVRAARGARAHVTALPTVHTAAFYQMLREAGVEAIFKGWEDPEIRPFVLKLISGGEAENSYRTEGGTR